MASREFVNDVPAWLEDMADEHMRQAAPMLDGFVSEDKLPPPIVAVFVKPTYWDDNDGIGQVDFIATTRDRTKVETTRVVPLPGQS